jgi:CPA1 family monovalent cation:H+ antiporter
MQRRAACRQRHVTPSRRSGNYVAFVLNSLVFLLLGLHLAQQHFSSVWRPAAAAIVIVLFGRALAVYPCCWLFSRSVLRVESKHQHLLFWGGLRGALALALALGLPAELPGREDIITVSFAVVASSIFVQGLTMPRLLHQLGELTSPRLDKPAA